jgi:hypothetical protein
MPPPTIKDFVEMEAQSLDEGTSTRVVCPWCEGGSSRERSLSISLKDGVALFNCYRNSCAKKGKVNLGGVLEAYRDEEASKAVDTWYWQHLYDKYNFSTLGPHHLSHVDIPTSAMRAAKTKYCIEENIYLTKVDNGFIAKRRSKVAGCILKNQKSKNILNGPNTGQLLRYATSRSGPIVIVEDILSAMAVFSYAENVAGVLCLFGTYLSGAIYQNLINTVGNATLLWCLDPDTNWGDPKYKQIRDIYPLHPHFFKVLDKDPKNMTQKELRSLLCLGN